MTLLLLLPTPTRATTSEFLQSDLPALSVAANLGSGLNLEAYYQFQWKPYSFPPAGTSFSMADTFDKGRDNLL